MLCSPIGYQPEAAPNRTVDTCGCVLGFVSEERCFSIALVVRTRCCFRLLAVTAVATGARQIRHWLGTTGFCLKGEVGFVYAMRRLVLLLTLCLSPTADIALAHRSEALDLMPSERVVSGDFQTVRTSSLSPAQVVENRSEVAASDVASASVCQFRRRTKAGVAETAFVSAFVFKSRRAARAYFADATRPFAAKDEVATERVGEATAARRNRYSDGARQLQNLQLLYVDRDVVWQVTVARESSTRRPFVETTVGIARRIAART